MSTQVYSYKFNNGGWKGAKRGDCVARAISIATEKPYDEIFNGLLIWAKEAKDLPNSKKVYMAFLHAHGGVIHDTYNPFRDETRCVYGYFYKEEK
mgnify:CR=1 FL=1